MLEEVRGMIVFGDRLGYPMPRLLNRSFCISMKKIAILTAVATLLTLPTLSFAKAPKGEKGDKGAKGEPAARFDTNHNGKIDKGEESEALRSAYAAEKDGPLKKYDTNHNGNLEDSEIAAIHFVPKHAK